MRLIVGIHTLYTQKGEFDYKPIWYLLEESFKNQYTAIKFSIDGGSKAKIYKNGVFGSDFSEIGIIPKNPSFLRYIMEIIYMFFYLIFAKIKYKKVSYLGIDPLSGFPGAILRKLGIIDKFILITPDFTEKRFDNTVLNSAYFFCDKICTYFSDYNYCSSTETIRRKNEIYKNISHKLKHIPGYPPKVLIDSIKAKEKKKNSIVFVGGIYGQIDLKDIFDQIHLLKSEYLDINFCVIGDGSHLEIYKNYREEKGYSDFIQILGYLDYEKTLDIISTYEVGLAIYNGDLFFDKYRDSCKVRDYLALNCIPVMTDVVPSTAKDIVEYNAGIVIKKEDSKNLAEIIKQIFIEKNTYYDGISKLNQKYSTSYDSLIHDLKVGK